MNECFFFLQLFLLFFVERAILLYFFLSTDTEISPPMASQAEIEDEIYARRLQSEGKYYFSVAFIFYYCE
jgi:hypothetical protein